ncbi:MAG: BrnT family toxin, partial [Gammaproteobacteria bacterium]|nr:BrnT family toxin [Gammaproteobacteria bacterium]
METNYDPNKNTVNRRKHGVDLEDAMPVLTDPKALVREDGDAEGEQRFAAVG